MSATGSSESHRVRLNLTLAVTRITWSPSTSSSDQSQGADPSQNQGASLQISGRVTSENPHVKLGAFHTLDVEANRDVRIEKDVEGWDSVALSRVEESCVPGRGAEVGAVVCGEGHQLYCHLAPMKIYLSLSQQELLSSVYCQNI